MAIALSTAQGRTLPGSAAATAALEPTLLCRFLLATSRAFALATTATAATATAATAAAASTTRATRARLAAAVLWVAPTAHVVLGAIAKGARRAAPLSLTCLLLPLLLCLLLFDIPFPRLDFLRCTLLPPNILYFGLLEQKPVTKDSRVTQGPPAWGHEIRLLFFTHVKVGVFELADLILDGVPAGRQSRTRRLELSRVHLKNRMTVTLK